MQFSSALCRATLLKRYKRFLVDLQKDNGDIFTAHCANTGKMTGCAETGVTAYYSTSDNAKRKYPHSLELTTNPQGDLICVNTNIANKVVIEAINNGVISELQGYQQLASEVKYGEENSRIDIFLTQGEQADCYVEVKSVTLLAQNGQGYFPDAKTLRGQKHLRELIAMRQAGCRAVLCFAVLHTGITRVSAAAHIDNTYATLLNQAIQAGVEVIAYQAHITPTEIYLTKALKYLPNLA